ncbi:MAG: hypothetical protein JO222_06075 [Frankiales bacterium]|nr:hypothetical protein [Frankiales bacterium]
MARARWLAATAAALVLAASGPALASGDSAAHRRPIGCVPRTLVLSAMPVELGPLLAQTAGVTLVERDGRDYFVGRLRGHDVVLALTGIGPVNARRSTAAVLAAFRCGPRSAIDSVVFSGVAGGDWIGSVTVPTRWTLDGGKHFFDVDRRMLAAARSAARSGVRLESAAPVGDPACGCVLNPDTVATVSVTHRPRVEFGGKGQTTDPFVGRALRCVPGGGDVLGCEPCVVQQGQLGPETTQFARSVVPFVDPSFFTGYGASSAAGKGYAAEDEETAAVDAVASAHHLPFLGFRAVSDGGGDPLGLPGFPVQFFYYRQLAADNAARMTLAFLSRWR